MKGKTVLDMYNLEEDKRIDLLAKFLQVQQEMQFMVDMPTVPEGQDKGSGIKEDRYLRKLQKLVPHEVVSRQEHYPVANVVTIKVRKLAG